jgi:hypothetical protein
MSRGLRIGIPDPFSSMIYIKMAIFPEKNC